jgi:hypothetical protein
MKWIARATLLVIVFSSLGCAVKDKIIGVWNTEIDQMGVKQTLTMNMAKDKTMDLTVDADIPQLGPVKVTAKGTYTSTENGKTVTPNLETITMDNKQLEAMKDALTANIKQQFNQELKPNWKSDDEFVVEINGVAMTFKRKK